MIILLKYHSLLPKENKIFTAEIGDNIVRLIISTHWMMRWVFHVAPVMDLENLNRIGNYQVALIFSIVFLGLFLKTTAEQIAERIRKTKKKVEEMEWEENLLRGKGRIKTSQSISSIEISLDGKDRWYTRPFGLVIIGVIIVVLGQISILSLGLL